MPFPLSKDQVPVDYDFSHIGMGASAFWPGPRLPVATSRELIIGRGTSGPGGRVATAAARTLQRPPSELSSLSRKRHDGTAPFCSGAAGKCAATARPLRYALINNPRSLLTQSPGQTLAGHSICWSSKTRLLSYVTPRADDQKAALATPFPLALEAGPATVYPP
ncbi:hypothetical protein SKAU_G00146590 [Synaphobranchus kaupii]|uniref:Uncharacterized protein n=1 Tax=Synaphobranchus kaupii TaxID=118154 RepID=A0A9Q1FUD6_SYNKA|nr:hypothetical protein SKAU_G00146590 [Synaphobranchus kaupii]